MGWRRFRSHQQFCIVSDQCRPAPVIPPSPEPDYPFHPWTVSDLKQHIQCLLLDVLQRTQVRDHGIVCSHDYCSRHECRRQISPIACFHPRDDGPLPWFARSYSYTPIDFPIPQHPQRLCINDVFVAGFSINLQPCGKVHIVGRTKPLRPVMPLVPFVPRRWSEVKETYPTTRADERTPVSVSRSDKSFPPNPPESVHTCRMPQPSVQYGPSFRSTSWILHKFRSSTSSPATPEQSLRYILPALRPADVFSLVRPHVTTLHHELRPTSHKPTRHYDEIVIVIRGHRHWL